MDRTVRRLEYFVVVGDELHVTRAAARLHVAQPSLSQAIRELESELGVVLFTRGRSMSLTPAGRVLHDAARRMLQEWALACEHARRLAADGRSLLRVAFLASAGGDTTRAFADALARRDPDCDLQLLFRSWDDPLCGLPAGECDLAFVYFPDDPQPIVDELADGIEVTVVRRERRYVLMSDTNPLARGDEVTISDLEDQPLIAPMAVERGRRWVDAWTAARHRSTPPRIGAVANSADALVELIAAGRGISLAMASSVQAYARAGLVGLPVVDLPHVALCLLSRRDDDRPQVGHGRGAALDLRDLGIAPTS